MRDKSNYKHYENVSITPEMLMFPFQAESVAYWVSQLNGIDSSNYSFGYIATWSKTKEAEELINSMDVICKTANIINDKLQNQLQINRSEKVENIIQL